MVEDFLYQGATGSSLLPENGTRLLGTEGIKVFITYYNIWNTTRYA
jgi:hypothetical protein